MTCWKFIGVPLALGSVQRVSPNLFNPHKKDSTQLQGTAERRQPRIHVPSPGHMSIYRAL